MNCSCFMWPLLTNASCYYLWLQKDDTPVLYLEINEFFVFSSLDKEAFNFFHWIILISSSKTSQWKSFCTWSDKSQQRICIRYSKLGGGGTQKSTNNLVLLNCGLFFFHVDQFCCGIFFCMFGSVEILCKGCIRCIPGGHLHFFFFALSLITKYLTH